MKGSQGATLSAILAVLLAFSSMSSFEAVSLFEHSSFDETPVDLRVTFEAEGKEKQKAKLFVHELEYGVLLRYLRSSALLPRDQFLFLRCGQLTQVRAAERTTAENIRNILMRTTLLQPPAAVTQEFRYRWRLSECDECPSNLKAERLFMEQVRGQHWQMLSFICAAHKAHSSATKCFEMKPEIVSGMVNSCKVLWDVKYLRAVKHVMKVEVQKRLRRHECVELPSLPRPAREFKEHVLRMFSPDANKAPRHAAQVAILAKLILNGDWRKRHILEHHCLRGCCADSQESERKVFKQLWTVFRLAKVTMFAKGNWSDWPRHMMMWGLLGHLHYILRDVLLGAFSRVAAAAAGAPAENVISDEDPEATREGRPERSVEDWERDREERAKALKASSAWLVTDWEVGVWMLRAALGPQISLMKALLFSTSTEAEVQDMHHHLTGGARLYRLLRLHRHVDSGRMLAETIATHASPSLWPMPETENTRSEIWRLCFKPAAYLFQSLMLRYDGFPFRLWRLVDDPSEETAKKILESPVCHRDPFTNQFLKTNNSIQSLLEESSRQALQAVGLMAKCTTFDTERIHSRNARRAHMRVHAARMEPETVALAHAARSGLAWQFLSPDRKKIGRKRGRPAKKKAAAVEEIATAAKKRKGADLPRRRGGGGAWRAFHHVNATQLPWGAESRQELKARFHSLRDDELAFYKQLGEAGACLLLCTEPTMPFHAPPQAAVLDLRARNPGKSDR